LEGILITVMRCGTFKESGLCRNDQIQLLEADLKGHIRKEEAGYSGKW
jgi:hypothetical protein